MKPKDDRYILKAIIRVSRYIIIISMIAVVCLFLLIISLFNNSPPATAIVPENQTANHQTVIAKAVNTNPVADIWKAPDVATIPKGKTGDMIRYGRELLAHTANYLGPKGSIAYFSNGMNCQNCHLDGGSRIFGNNYAGFIASYPKMSNRSGKVEPASERIAECFERSLAGRSPDTNGREIQAMLAYMKWLGQNVKKGKPLYGTATEKLPYLNYAADPLKGKAVYVSMCKKCHGANGEGLLAADKSSYIYPPLWGNHSYNDGAGMYRLGNFAGFVKDNMPFGATYQNPQLTNEQAWNVAAFVNSQPRPHRDQHNDWQNLKNKPIDAPFGPYADKFSQQQHKYGPFKPIKDAQTETATKKS